MSCRESKFFFVGIVLFCKKMGNCVSPSPVHTPYPHKCRETKKKEFVPPLVSIEEAPPQQTTHWVSPFSIPDSNSVQNPPPPYTTPVSRLFYYYYPSNDYSTYFFPQKEEEELFSKSLLSLSNNEFPVDEIMQNKNSILYFLTSHRKKRTSVKTQELESQGQTAGNTMLAFS